MKKKLATIFLILMMISGFAILLYPKVSNWLAKRNQIKTVQNFHKAVEEFDTEELEAERNKAIEYNQSLQNVQISDPFGEEADMNVHGNYNEILDFGNGIMAELSIPCIDVNLPIYHGTGEKILEKGIGHIHQSSFPIGGEGYHAILSGHTGLPSVELLTDLEKLKIGDRFYIKILKDTLAYEVDSILVVEPYDTSALQPVEGKDYVTLVTCTPYGINTQRLLVRGVRVPYIADEESEGSYTVNKIIGPDAISKKMIVCIAGGVVLLILIVIIVVLKKDKKINKEN